MGKFQEMINSDVPVLVDFYATWCGPCKVMAPVLEKVASKMGNSAKVIKVDVDKNQQAASVYEVRGVPTFIIFKNGKQLWRQSGVIPEEMLLQQLQLAARTS